MNCSWRNDEHQRGVLIFKRGTAGHKKLETQVPVSPRTQHDGESDHPGGSSSGGKRKSKSRPTTSRRNLRQKLKAQYAKAREDAQLAGIIPTTPEGALKPEMVSPSVQSVQPLSEMVERAIKKGWAVEDGKKPDLVEELVRIVMDPNMPAKAKIAAFSALRTADESQWGRDNPSASASAKGGTSAIAISVSTNISATDLMQRMLADGAIRLEQITGTCPPIITSSARDSGHAGEVEAGTTPPDDQPEASERLGDPEQ